MGSAQGTAATQDGTPQIDEAIGITQAFSQEVETSQHQDLGCSGNEDSHDFGVAIIGPARRTCVEHEGRLAHRQRSQPKKSLCKPRCKFFSAGMGLFALLAKMDISIRGINFVSSLGRGLAVRCLHFIHIGM